MAVDAALHGLRDNIPRSQISPYPLGGSSDSPRTGIAIVAVPFRLVVVSRALPEWMETQTVECIKAFQPSYSASHYGMTDPSSFMRYVRPF
jgi:hypothetical protein